MRRVLALGGVVYALSGGVACTQRRGLRKRRGVEGPTHAEYTNDNNNDNKGTQAMPGDGQRRENTNMSTTAGQLSTLASSLDRIRAELRAMQEAAEDKERSTPIAQREHEQERDDEEGSNKQDSLQLHRQMSSAELDKDLLRLLQQRHRPNEAYYRGREVQDAMAVRAKLLRRQLYNETEEVIRHHSKADIAHYCRLAFPAWSTSVEGTESVQRLDTRNNANSEGLTSAERGQAAVLQRARALQGRVRDEATAIVREILVQQQPQQQEEGRQGETKHSDAQSGEAEAALHDAPLVRELAWVRVLDALSSDELKQLWEDGVMDYDVLESLATDHSAPAAMNEKGEDEAKKREALQTQEEVANDAQEDDQEDEQEGGGYILDDKLAALEKLEYLAALTREVHENTLQNVASLDLAPTLEKVRQGEYSAISASELKQLEAYEEKPLVQPATHNTSRQESTAMHPLHHEVKMTEALLNQALLPSNRLLHAVARHDPIVREALDALEKIKCATVLDGDFQDALQTASTLEDALEDTIRHHVGRPSLRALAAASVHRTNNEEEAESEVGDDVQGSNGKEEKADDVHGRGRRQRTRYSNRARRASDDDDDDDESTSVRPWRGRPARPYHAADIPYFFHSLYSRVPPQADFNLPAPALSAQEKAALRGRRRRLRGPAHFAR